MAVVRDGGLLSVYRTVQATESVDEDEFQVDVYTTMTSIVLVCVGLVVCVTTWNSDFTPQREAEPVAQPH